MSLQCLDCPLEPPSEITIKINNCDQTLDGLSSKGERSSALKFVVATLRAGNYWSRPSQNHCRQSHIKGIITGNPPPHRQALTSCQILTSRAPNCLPEAFHLLVFTQYDRLGEGGALVLVFPQSNSIYHYRGRSRFLGCSIWRQRP